jgi:hypothetical protein
MIAGAIRAPSVRNRPSAKVMSADVVSTDSLKVYFSLLVFGLAYVSTLTSLAKPSGMVSASVLASGRKALHEGHVLISLLTSVLQLRHNQALFSLLLIFVIVFLCLIMVDIATCTVARTDVACVTIC